MQIATMIAMVMRPVPLPRVARTAASANSSTVAKQKQVKMQMQVGRPGCDPAARGPHRRAAQSESKHRVAAKAILGARAAERYDVDAARKYFNEALAGCHPQERPALRQMMKASMALAERRPDDLKDGDGEARPGGPLRPPAVHAADDGAADPARERGDRGPRSAASCC